MQPNKKIENEPTRQIQHFRHFEGSAKSSLNLDLKSGWNTRTKKLFEAWVEAERMGAKKDHKDVWLFDVKTIGFLTFL